MVIDRENQSEPIKKSAVLGDHGELWIKLKLPKDEGQDFVEEDQNPQWEDHQLSTNNKTTRICHVCNKAFRSGKALGGHMRIHFQAHKEPIFNKKLKPSQPIKFKKRKREEVTLADIARKINISKSKTTNGTAGFTENPTCSLCCKTFPSMKSLFGHMRCHPDREWRGIQPPPAVKTSSSSLVSDVEPQDSDDQVNSAVPHEDQAPVDLTKSLCGWSATAKRGRKKTILDSSEDEEFLDAAQELMRLAHGGSFGSSLTNKQRVEEYEATNSNSLTYKAESEDTNRVSESKKRSFEEFSAGYTKGHPMKQLSFPNDGKFEGLQLNGMIDMDYNKAADETGFLAGKSVNCQWEDTSNWPKEYEDEDCTDDESDSKNTEQLNHKTCKSTNGKVIMFKNKKKRKKIKDLDSVHDASPGHQPMTATPDKYRCSTCDKSFPTHQALGGHMSSHNKIRWTSASGEDENLANSPILDDEEIKESEGAASSKQVDDTHQCKICSRNFSTGQALGGHKKCHSAGGTEAPSSQVTSLGELSHTCGGRVLEFDLNEAPPPEDDAGFASEHVAAGCGHASSSFNSVEFPVFESSSSRL